MRYRTSPCNHLINTIIYYKLIYIRTTSNFTNKYWPITSWFDHSLSALSIWSQWRHNDMAPPPRLASRAWRCQLTSLMSVSRLRSVGFSLVLTIIIVDSMSIYWFSSMVICSAPSWSTPTPWTHHLTPVVIPQNDTKLIKNWINVILCNMEFSKFKLLPHS
jgi:hypothetical protein